MTEILELHGPWLAGCPKMTRPTGSNSDEWYLFLLENLDRDLTRPDGLPYIAVQISEVIEALEKKVFVPGQWRCAKCEFRLTQSNLYAATGTVGPRDQPGDKCPNCNGPLWRVSAMDDRNEAFKCANETFDRVLVAEQRVKELEKERNELVDQLSYADLRASGGLPERQTPLPDHQLNDASHAGGHSPQP